MRATSPGGSIEHQDPGEVAALSATLSDSLAQLDVSRAKDRELTARVVRLEKELRTSRNQTAVAERQLQAIKQTNAQLMRLRQGEQSSVHAPAQPAQARGAQPVGQPQGRGPSQPPPVHSNAAPGRSGGTPRGAPTQASQMPQPAARSAQQTQARLQPPANQQQPPPVPPAVSDPAGAVRAQLRDAMFAADGPRLQMAVEAADRLGMSAEAAHGRKKLGTLQG